MASTPAPVTLPQQSKPAPVPQQAQPVTVVQAVPAPPPKKDEQQVSIIDSLLKEKQIQKDQESKLAESIDNSVDHDLIAKIKQEAEEEAFSEDAEKSKKKTQAL